MAYLSSARDSQCILCQRQLHRLLYNVLFSFFKSFLLEDYNYNTCRIGSLVVLQRVSIYTFLVAYWSIYYCRDCLCHYLLTWSLSPLLYRVFFDFIPSFSPYLIWVREVTNSRHPAYLFLYLVSYHTAFLAVEGFKSIYIYTYTPQSQWSKMWEETRHTRTRLVPRFIEWLEKWQIPAASSAGRRCAFTTKRRLRATDDSRLEHSGNVVGLHRTLSQNTRDENSA